MNQISSIVNSIIQSVCPGTNITCTENLDKAYNTTGSKCLDFFTRITRNAEMTDYIATFAESFQEADNTAIKMLLNLRDVRGGKGEKLIPIVIMVLIKNTLSKDTYKMILSKFVEYGCWKDILRIVEIHNRVQLELNPNVVIKNIDNTIEYKMFADQLLTDYSIITAEYVDDNTKKGISLCAKWAPSEKTHFNKHPIYAANQIAKMAGKNPKQYRLMISVLREHLNILERLMSMGQVERIDFSKIPSIAMKKMKQSFGRDSNSEGITSENRTKLHQSYQQYLTELTAGTTKVNIKGIQPHELVSTYLRKCDIAVDPLVEGQWIALVNRVKESGIFKNTSAIVDTSGSMAGQPLEVAVAMGILVAECTECSDPNILTFSDNPRWHTLTGSNLQEKVKCMDYSDWGGSTNLRKTFDLILEDAIRLNLAPDKVVSTLIIFTDMQFNSVNSGHSWETTFETGKKAFEAHGYVFPKIICWNLRTSTTKSLPVTKNEEGYAMLSGFSSELLKHILNGEEFTPLSMMMHVLEPYDITLQDYVITDKPFTINQLQKAVTSSTLKKAFKKKDDSKQSLHVSVSNTTSQNIASWGDGGW